MGVKSHTDSMARQRDRERVTGKDVLLVDKGRGGRAVVVHAKKMKLRIFALHIVAAKRRIFVILSRTGSTVQPFATFCVQTHDNDDGLKNSS